MLVIGLIGGKGGCGKSTLSLGLATEAAQPPPGAELGALVSLYDADPQASTTRWHDTRVMNGVGSMRPDGRRNPDLFRDEGRGRTRRGVSIAQVVDDLFHVGEHTLIIDSGPGSTTRTREIIGLAHACVVPINPSPLDLAANDEAITLLRARGVPFVIVLNRVATSGAAKAYADDIAELVIGEGLPLAKTRIAARQSYVQSWIEGRSGPEADTKAHKEMAALWNEVRALAEARARQEAGE